MTNLDAVVQQVLHSYGKAGEGSASAGSGRVYEIFRTAKEPLSSSDVVAILKALGEEEGHRMDTVQRHIKGLILDGKLRYVGTVTRPDMTGRKQIVPAYRIK